MSGRPKNRPRGDTPLEKKLDFGISQNSAEGIANWFFKKSLSKKNQIRWRNPKHAFPNSFDKS